jgi:outer membrane protein OmpA-like peptidoglycan-associated protein
MILMYKAILTISLLLVFSTAFAQRETDTFRLYFDLDIAALNAATEKKIDLLVYNDKIINGSNIMIIGYADYLGTEGYNQGLSMRRAKNVKSYLVKYGINAEYIKLCLGKGEIERTGIRTKDGMPTDRRVDIVVDNAPPRRPAPEKTTSSHHYKRDTVRKSTASNIEDIKHLKPGAIMLLKNVYFPADRHTIRPESKETLEKLYSVLRDYPRLKISIEGHVCCIKDAADALDIDTYEPTLSLNRARAIYNYLVSRGIDSSRLRYEGFGRRKPVIPVEQTEQDAELNRRVEIRVIENP